MTRSLPVPLLSVCVPSRNRQVYFKETIRSLVASRRTDVEFVFADNSDNPAVMNDHFAGLADDPRVTFLPSGDRVYSMIDNWERTVAAARGQWVTVIGDDDFLDPDLAIVLARAIAQIPDLEAFEWQRLSYAWPNPGKDKPTNVDVGFDSGIQKVSREMMLRRAFLWEGAGVSPKGGFSIYHAALSRGLIDRIKSVGQGRLFVHPVVDFDSAFRVAWLGKSFAFCLRPFSIMGACPESNSAGLLDLKEMRKRHQDFMDELGQSIDSDPSVRDFPFASILGVTAIVMQVQLKLRAEHNLAFPGWESNFVKSCAKNCEEYYDREAFDIVSEGYRAAVKRWKGGRYLNDFRPVYNEAAAAATEVFSGAREGKIYLSMPLLAPQTPADLYAVVTAMLPSADEFDASLR